MDARCAFKQCLALVLLLTSLFLPVHAKQLSSDPKVTAFINEMVEDYQYDRTALIKAFNNTNYQQNIIKAMSKPAEKKPWYQYRRIFLTRKRINGGVDFWKKNDLLLKRAEKVYGVPASIITAILGVETLYGAHTGRYKVMDSLSTLAFQYPPRADFFRRELQQFLLLAREEAWDPISLKGSYAGAMGAPQFIASSYRHYAIDFSGDGHRDLLHNTEDTIGSIAYYLNKHGWQAGEHITAPITTPGKSYQASGEDFSKPEITIAAWRNRGVVVDESLKQQSKASLIKLHRSAQDVEWWLGLTNFYVITRYNHSPLYAMAVYQLSDAITKEKNKTDNKTDNG